MAHADDSTRARALARAREAGLVLRSPDLSSSLALLVALAGVWLMGGPLMRRLMVPLELALTAPADVSGAWPRVLSASQEAALSLLGFLSMLALFALLSGALQTFWGGAARPRFALDFDLARPLRGLGAPERGLLLLWMAVKVGVLLLVMGGLFFEHSPRFAVAMDGPVSQLGEALTTLASEGAVRLVWTLCLVAALDMLVQRQRMHMRVPHDPWLERQLQRAEEGDPAMRARVRARMRDGERPSALRSGSRKGRSKGPSA